MYRTFSIGFSFKLLIYVTHFLVVKEGINIDVTFDGTKNYLLCCVYTVMLLCYFRTENFVKYFLFKYIVLSKFFFLEKVFHNTLPFLVFPWIYYSSWMVHVSAKTKNVFSALICNTHKVLQNSTAFLIFEGDFTIIVIICTALLVLF